MNVWLVIILQKYVISSKISGGGFCVSCEIPFQNKWIFFYATFISIKLFRWASLQCEFKPLNWWSPILFLTPLFHKKILKWYEFYQKFLPHASFLDTKWINEDQQLWRNRWTLENAIFDPDFIGRCFWNCVHIVPLYACICAGRIFKVSRILKKIVEFIQ